MPRTPMAALRPAPMAPILRPASGDPEMADAPMQPAQASCAVQPAQAGCAKSCQTATSIEALNRSCHCLSLDEDALRGGLEADLGRRSLSRAMVETHPHLFASVPMFVSQALFCDHEKNP